MWRNHLHPLLLVVFVTLSTLVMAYHVGVAEHDPLNWPDVIGEFTALGVAISWLALIVTSRPGGRISQWLVFGCILLVYSSSLDLLDEFVDYPADMRIFSYLESLPGPIAMLCLTIGLIGWHREQLALNRQLQGRERFFRDHKLLDPLTQLYGPAYLQQLLAREILLLKQQRTPLCLVLFDVMGFRKYNQQHGIAAGDKLLKDLSHLFSSMVRRDAVICRITADRFVLVLPNTDIMTAYRAAEQLELSIHQLLTHQPSVTSLVWPIDANDPDLEQDAVLAAQLQLNAAEQALHFEKTTRDTAMQLG